MKFSKIFSTLIITSTLLFSAYSQADFWENYWEDVGNCLRNDDEGACRSVEKNIDQYCKEVTGMAIEYFVNLVAAKDKNEFANIRQELLKKHQKWIEKWEWKESDIAVVLLPSEKMAEVFHKDYSYYQQRQEEMRSKKFKDFVSSAKKTAHQGCSIRMNSLLTATPDPIFEELCHSGLIGHCLTLAMMSYVKQKYARAIPFFKLSCNDGDGAACYFLAEIYLHGKEVQKNDEIAMLYSSKGCKLKDEDACDIYNSLKSEE